MSIWIKAQLRSPIAMNASMLIAMRVFGAATGMVYWAIAARTMPAAALGLASGAIAAATLLAGLAQLGLGYGLVRHLADADDPDGMISQALLLTGGAGLLFGALFLALLPAWSSELMPLRASPAAAVLFLALAVSTALTQLMHWVFMAAGRLVYSLWKIALQSLLAILLLPVLGLLVAGYTANVAAYTLSTVLGLWVCFRTLLPLARPGYRFSPRRRARLGPSFAGYALVNFAADQFQRAPDALLPLVIIQQLGAEAGAYFFVVWTLGRGMSAWVNSGAEALFVAGARQRGGAGHTGEAVRIGLLLAGGLSAGTFLAGRAVLAIYGPDYIEQGVELLNLIALASFPGVLLYTLVSWLRIRGRLRAVSTIMALSAGLGMLCSALMAEVSLAGVGAGWLGAQTAVLAGAAAWLLWRERRPGARGPDLSGDTRARA